MPTIRHLDQSTINKIAAGEVIERPASVVKELLENAIDAKADDIRIDLLRAGKQQIKLSDNGSGMAKDDLLICYKKHTTSKISGEQDLFTITSLGFRGEALASIAEIANLKITTKTKASCRQEISMADPFRVKNRSQRNYFNITRILKKINKYDYPPVGNRPQHTKIGCTAKK